VDSHIGGVRQQGSGERVTADAGGRPGPQGRPAAGAGARLRLDPQVVQQHDQGAGGQLDPFAADLEGDGLVGPLTRASSTSG
jgi:hypothetical protein